MILALADTHAAVWYLYDDRRLSRAASATLDRARDTDNQIGVSSITFVEMVYLIERDRIPADALTRLTTRVTRPGEELTEVALTSGIAEAMRRVARRQVPDMPDRIIAATALYLGLPLNSRDGRIRASGMTTIW